jgi:hypothetical protein
VLEKSKNLGDSGKYLVLKIAAIIPGIEFQNIIILQSPVYKFSEYE